MTKLKEDRLRARIARDEAYRRLAQGRIDRAANGQTALREDERGYLRHDYTAEQVAQAKFDVAKFDARIAATRAQLDE